MISDKDFNDLKRSVEIVQRKVARVDGDPIILASPGKRFDLNDHLNVVKLKLGIANLKEYAENSNNALGNHNHGKGTVNTLTKYSDINGNICDSVMHENDGKIGVNIVPKSAFHVNNPDPVDTFLQVTNGVTGSSDSLDGLSLGVLADGSSVIRTSYSRELAFLFEGSDEGMPLVIDKAGSIALSTRTNYNPYTLRLNGRIAIGMMVDEPEDNLQVHGPFNSFVRITTDAVGITDGFVLGTDGSMRSVMRGGYQGHIYIQDESTPGVFDNVIDFDPRESTIRIDGNEVLHAGNLGSSVVKLNASNNGAYFQGGTWGSFGLASVSAKTSVEIMNNLYQDVNDIDIYGTPTFKAIASGSASFLRLFNSTLTLNVKTGCVAGQAAPSGTTYTLYHSGNFTPPNQSLNTTSSPTFAGLAIDAAMISSLSLGSARIEGWGDNYVNLTTPSVTFVSANVYMDRSSGFDIWRTITEGPSAIFSVNKTGELQLLKMASQPAETNITPILLATYPYTVWHSGNLTPAAIGAAAATSGEFTATWSGGTFIVKWKKLDNEVILKFPEIGSITPKSQIIFSGMPDTLRPVSDFRTIASCRNSTGFGTSCILIIPNNTGSSVGFGSDATFLYVTKQSISYSLD